MKKYILLLIIPFLSFGQDECLVFENNSACASNNSSGGADPRVDKIIAHIAKKEDVSDIS